jgi:hypothetical protein
MTVTVVLPEVDAIAVFGRPEMWMTNPPRPAPGFIPKSVKWIVVPEPLACSTCQPPDDFPFVPYCPDCLGTGLPDVRSVSMCDRCNGNGTDPGSVDHACRACDGCSFTVHGVVSIGAAVKICTAFEPRPNTAIRVGFFTNKGTWLIEGDHDPECTDITNEFGGQPLIGWAHPILSTGSGT